MLAHSDRIRQVEQTTVTDSQQITGWNVIVFDDVPEAIRSNHRQTGSTLRGLISKQTFRVRQNHRRLTWTWNKVVTCGHTVVVDDASAEGTNHIGFGFVRQKYE